MSWTDLGVIFPVDRLSDWARSHGYVPTAIDLGDRIRVYAAFWDANQRGRIGYVDVDSDDPTRILRFSSTPVLDDGAPGQFDCDGATPLTVAFDGSQYRLYYAGWRRLEEREARYTLFTGMAFSSDGERFERVSHNPVLGPTGPECLVRTGGYFMKDAGRWRCWFADFVENIFVKSKWTPSYCLATLDSPDGIHWPDQSRTVFETTPGDIFGYGRGSVWKDAPGYRALFSIRRTADGYGAIEYSESADGYQWTPPSLSGLAFSAANTRDAQTQVAFPSLIFRKDCIVMFYSGDDFGRAGIRAAVWRS